jgi:hypothetical protein
MIDQVERLLYPTAAKMSLERKMWPCRCLSQRNSNLRQNDQYVCLVSSSPSACFALHCMPFALSKQHLPQFRHQIWVKILVCPAGQIFAGPRLLGFRGAVRFLELASWHSWSWLVGIKKMLTANPVARAWDVSSPDGLLLRMLGLSSIKERRLAIVVFPVHLGVVTVRPCW